MNTSPAIGSVVPFERNAPEREEYEQAVRLWCLDRNLSEALSREEIAGMQRLDRMDVQRKALILNLIHYFRKHERADVAPGVAVIIHLMSDNDKGASTVSQATMAKLFNRSGSSIADAHRRLKEDEIIIAGRGRYPMTVPVIPRAVARSYNHLAWLLSAAADTSDKPLNLPVPSEDCQSSGPVNGLKQSLGGSCELRSVNLPVEGVSIFRPDPIQIQSRNSKEDTLDVRDARSLTKAVALGIAAATASLPAAAAPPEPPAIVQPAKPSLAEMTDRMTDAAGAALANPAAHAGLLTYGELQRWLSTGHDFEGDILPAIRARCARAAPGSIKSWRYFEQGVADNKAARLRPMPEGRAAPPSGSTHWRDQEIARLDAFFKL
jgi:hypothetical protein